MTVKIPPMIRPNETDDEYDERLQAAGISPNDFEEWFESVFPSSTGDFTHASIGGDGDSDEDDKK